MARPLTRRERRCEKKGHKWRPFDWVCVTMAIHNPLVCVRCEATQNDITGFTRGPGRG